MYLGQVLDPRHAVVCIPVLPIVLRGHELARLQAALHEVNIPRLVQLVAAAAPAPQHDLAAAELLEDAAHVLERVVRAGAGLDAGQRQRRVRVEHAEQPRRPREVVDHLAAPGPAVAVALGAQRVDARRVLVVLVRPQVRVAAPVRDPVPVHERPQVVLPVVRQDVGDVVVVRCHVAVRVVGAVAEVGPVGDGVLSVLGGVLWSGKCWLGVCLTIAREESSLPLLLLHVPRGPRTA